MGNLSCDVNLVSMFVITSLVAKGKCVYIIYIIC